MKPEIIVDTSRKLRINMTRAEKVLWNELKEKKIWYKFQRQKPLYLYTENSWLDRYIIPDFYCVSEKLIIEIDWNIHEKKEVLLLDKEKEKLIKNKSISPWFTFKTDCQ